MPDAGGLDAETAGTGGAEGMQHRVKQRHSPQHQQRNENHRHDQIDAVQNQGGLPHPGHQLAAGGTGNLCFHNIQGLSLRLGQHRQHKHQHAHAAYPVGKAAPEQHSPAHGLHIGQNAGTGGGKAGYRLKKSVHKPGNLPGNHKRQGAENGHQRPGQAHNQKAFFGVDGRISGLFPCHGLAHRQQGGNGQQKRHRALFIQQAHRRRQQHQRRLHFQQGAHRV